MNIVEFAEKIGVSRTTVCSAVNGNGRVSPKTRQMILKKAEELGLTLSRSAQALRTGRTYLVELWIPNLQTQFSGFVVNHMQQHLNSRGFDLIVHNIDEAEGIPQYLHRKSAWGVEGVLAVDPPESTIASLREMMGHDMPVVNLGGNYVTSIDFVGIDDYHGAAEATQHLIRDAGCKTITFLVDTRSVRFEVARYKGVMDTAREAGVEVHLVELDKPTSSEGWRAMHEYVEAHGHPDGVFCVNDSVALGVQSVLIRNGVKIPEDTAIVGCDGLEFTAFLPVLMSTIELPTSDMCEKALGFLLNRIEDRSLPRQEAILKPRLIVRESSDRRQQ